MGTDPNNERPCALGESQTTSASQIRYRFGRNRLAAVDPRRCRWCQASYTLGCPVCSSVMATNIPLQNVTSSIDEELSPVAPVRSIYDDDPRELRRHISEVSIHSETVGVSPVQRRQSRRATRNSRTSSGFSSGPTVGESDLEGQTIHDTLPAFGAGKPYPPTAPEKEQYVVEFDGPDDPEHPMNWHIRRKLGVMVAYGFATAVVAIGSSIFAPAVSYIMPMFNIGEVVAVLSISLYVIGFASGPLIWAPLSELYGRKLPVLVSIFICGVFMMAVARSQDLQSIMICRFFAGFFGASLLAVAPATFSDMFGNKTRGLSMAIFATTVFCAPLLGPVVGAFICQSYLGWRWTMYLTSIMAFAATVLVLFCEETYAPVVLKDKARRLRRETGNWCIHARQEEVQLSFKELVERNLSRPLKMLFQEPILFLISLYTAFVYGILYLLLEVYPLIFYNGYHMSAGVSELPYLGCVVGQILGGIIVLAFEPYTFRKIEANGGLPVPEVRLLPTIIGGISFTIGLFWLTWAGNYPDKVHWIVPTLAGIFAGIGLISIFLSAINYIIESYLMFAASAMAANTFFRSSFGAGFPLFARAMFNNLGINWAGTLLGCLALVLVPVPVCFYLWGHKLRKASKYAPNLGGAGKGPASPEVEEAEVAAVEGADETSALEKPPVQAAPAGSTGQAAVPAAPAAQTAPAAGQVPQPEKLPRQIEE
ncbi:major facilitator superfamily domain-containing protein [Dipodascopsis tothii]|uniref:major facilitator superfamily domain-containing protein n=1 Tax=Dipodascopsis tothii TaxID=44089 RepID=UPI0034CD9D50